MIRSCTSAATTSAAFRFHHSSVSPRRMPGESTDAGVPYTRRSEREPGYDAQGRTVRRARVVVAASLHRRGQPPQRGRGGRICQARRHANGRAVRLRRDHRPHLPRECPYYRTYLKYAMLQGVAVVNNPFMWTADDKFFEAALATKLGIASPKTLVLPNKDYMPGIVHTRACAT